MPSASSSHDSTIQLPEPTTASSATTAYDDAAVPMHSPTRWLNKWAERTTGRHVEVEPDPHWQDRPNAVVALDDTFIFELAIGNHLDGYELMAIQHDGSTTRLYPDLEEQPHGPPRTVWRMTTFQTTRATIERLISVFNTTRFLQLPLSYNAVDIHEGTVFLLHLRTAGKDKYISVGNTAPDPVIAIVSAIASELVDTDPALYTGNQSAPMSHHYYSARLEADLGCYKLLAPAASYKFLSKREYRQLHTFSCRKYVYINTVPEESFSTGVYVEATLIDRTNNGKVVGRVRSREPSFYFPYSSKLIRPTHRHAVRIKLVEGGKDLSFSDAVPALAGTIEHALSISLPRPGSN